MSLGTIGVFTETYEEVHGEWKITDFFSLPKDKGNYYQSPTFSFAENSWYLQFYPGGETEKSDGFISLFLKKVSEPLKTVECKLGIKNAEGKLEVMKKFTHTFKDGTWGYGKFFERSKLVERPMELVPIDTLTIICIMKRGVVHTTEVQALPMNLIELETLSRNFKDLFANEKNCDMTLRVKEKEFQVHKSVLVARSSVFAAMFQHKMTESETGVISIDDCDPASFEDFLLYLYSGKLENISFQSALNLYTTSDKYEVSELKSFCVQYLKKNLTVENVCDAISFADLYNETLLLSAVQTFFNKNFSKILVTTKWEELLRNNYRLANKMLIEMSSKVKVED